MPANLGRFSVVFGPVRHPVALFRDAVPAIGATLRDKRVLVVEDEALVAMMVEDELADAGAKVIGPASSADEALRLIEGAASDGGLSVAVLDIHLGGERVLQVADRLVELGVPFLFATRYGEGCNTGGHAAPILRKLFHPAALIAALEALASASR